jgi:hypothetical protein
MTTPIGAPTYEALDRVIVGLETPTRGTKATPTNPWYGKLDIMRHLPLADTKDYGGTWFGDVTPTRGAISVDGTFTGKLAYEDACLFRYAIKDGLTPTDDGNSTHGYTWLFQHSGARDDIATFSAEQGDPVMVHESQGLFLPEITVSADIDDAEAAWKVNARVAGLNKDLKTGQTNVAATSGSTTTFVKTAWALTIDAWIGSWVHFKTGTAGNIDLWREVLDNDATSLTFAALPSAVAAADTIDLYATFTAGIADRTRELIIAPGTKLYLDTGTIGTTLVSGRFISFSVTASLGQDTGYKRFMENITTLSNRMDRGFVKVTGQVRLEMDRRSEWDAWIASTPEKIRIVQTGSTINVSPATTKKAQIDIYAAQWGDPTFDTRKGNKTASWPFTGYQDVSGTGVPLGITFVNKQATLLA